MQVTIYQSATEFMSAVKKINPRGKIAALDIGEKKIGIALSSCEIILAIPHSIYSRKNIKTDLDFFKSFAKQNMITGLIIGLPLLLQGEMGEQAKKIMSFSKKLGNTLNLPIIFEDERYTTQIANTMMIDLGLNRKKRNLIDDKISAMLILQSFIKTLSSLDR